MTEYNIANFRPEEINTRWPNFITTPTTTATTCSNSPEYNNNLHLRIENLELLVNNLLNRIVELEQNNNYISNTSKYNWSSETKTNLNQKYLTRSTSNPIDYFVKKPDKK